MLNKVTIYRSGTITDGLVIEMRKPELSGFLVRSISGLGPPRANINMTNSIGDGAVFNSARGGYRNILFDFVYVGHDIESVRRKSYRYFKLKSQVRIVFETDSRTAEVVGYVESNDPVIFSNQAGASISVLCPTTYLTSLETQITNFSATNPVFEFPFSNESLILPLIEFSVLELQPVRTIFYNGDGDTGIVIKIHAIGHVGKNIKIYNTESGESIEIDMDKILAITGDVLESGDDIVISSIRGRKYAKHVRLSTETNILNALVKLPSWFTISQGDNVFALYNDGETDFFHCFIENPILYEGI